MSMNMPTTTSGYPEVTYKNDSEQAANPGVPYGKVVREKFHADSINGRKMTDADWRGWPERAQGVNIGPKRRSGGEFPQESRHENALYVAYPTRGHRSSTPLAWSCR